MKEMWRSGGRFAIAATAVVTAAAYPPGGAAVRERAAKITGTAVGNSH